MGQNRQYSQAYKLRAGMLAKEISIQNVALVFGIPCNTLYGWYQAAQKGELDVGPVFCTPMDSILLAEEEVMLRQRYQITRFRNR